jgi:hypothetical protein
MSSFLSYAWYKTGREGTACDTRTSSEGACPGPPTALNGTFGTDGLTTTAFPVNQAQIPAILIDTIFGNDGESAVTSSIGTIKAIGIQSTGKIVVGGEVGAGPDRDLHLARFDPN